jgi:uncharacterized protein (TIGR02145 family)
MKRIKSLSTTSLLVVTIFSSCGPSAEEIVSSRKDKLNYKEVVIGQQIWMAENLDISTFRNGDKIPYVKSDEAWKDAGQNQQPAWCYYNNDPANGEKYGKLYNWYAVNDPRGLAPEGWHIPLDTEWTKLTDNLGGELVAGVSMKSISGWKKSEQGMNKSGFSARPTDFRQYNGIFMNGKNAYYWSATQNNENNVWIRALSDENGVVFRMLEGKGYGLPIRCLRD